MKHVRAIFVTAALAAFIALSSAASVLAACTPATTPNTSGVTANSQLEVLESICNSATAGSSYNGTGSTTHSGVTTAYGTGGQLFANNTGGNAVASTITVTGTNAGTGLISKALVETNGPNQPPTIILWLFSGTPTTTTLVDRSTYIGPYAADITSGIYIGSITCSSWNKTNDGTAQYFSECSTSGLVSGFLPFKALAGSTNINVLEEILGAYTPASSETHTYLISTLRDN